MTVFRTLLFLVGYFLYFGPPRAIDLQRSENAKGGELSGLPAWMVLGVEALLRGGSLLVVAVLLESVLGSYWYSHFQLDLAMGVIILVGSCHMCAYFLVFCLFRDRLGGKAGRVYRFARNFCYAFLPGLAVMDGFLLWDALNPMEELGDSTLLYGYGVTTLALLAIGIAEASLVKRKPLGLDKSIV